MYDPAAELMTLQFDTDDVCKISTVKFNTDSQKLNTKNACETINSTTEVRSSLIAEIKEGTCK